MNKITNPTLRYFADMIERETGIMYGEDNSYQLENRLADICRALDVTGLDQLHQLGVSGALSGLKRQFILDTATNNETSFFRDPRIFKAFEDFVLPEALKLVSAGPLRIWSVASSFGQEPYSLAIILKQKEEAGALLKGAEILTTDISHRALERVREAKYSHLEVQRGLPINLLIKFFEKQADESWQLKPEVRTKVSAQHMNLLDIVGVHGAFHVVFCRNVLIYQAEDKKREIVRKLANFLLPGGFFVLGAAESLMAISDEFEQVVFDSAIFYRKK